MTYPTFHNLIGGQWLPAVSGKTILNLNPAEHSDVVGAFPSSHAEDVALAVAAAKKAFATWRLVPAPKRAEILVTREMGKVLAETRGDVQEAIDEAFYVAGEGRRLFGKTTPSELQNKFAMSIRMPLGVVGLITPWNFPMAIPSWKLFPALVSGNTCVIKPATDTPLSTYNLVQALMDAGLPPGVVNIVSGTGSAVGTALVEHPDVRAISFTGSSAVGSVQAGLARNGRQERADCDGRRQSGPGARRRAVGSLWNHRAAMHGHKPHPVAEGNCRGVYGALCGARKEAEGGQRIG
jgi:aldehyde dehydrogenase (NAD+)